MQSLIRFTLAIVFLTILFFASGLTISWWNNDRIVNSKFYVCESSPNYGLDQVMWIKIEQTKNNDVDSVYYPKYTNYLDGKRAYWTWDRKYIETSKSYIFIFDEYTYTTRADGKLRYNLEKGKFLHTLNRFDLTLEQKVAKSEGVIIRDVLNCEDRSLRLDLLESQNEKNKQKYFDQRNI